MIKIGRDEKEEEKKKNCFYWNVFEIREENVEANKW